VVILPRVIQIYTKFANCYICEGFLDAVMIEQAVGIAHSVPESAGVHFLIYTISQPNFAVLLILTCSF
jgi:hypothetical protein